jgi:hypothetical protein
MAFDLERLYKKTTKVGDCQIWTKPYKGAYPRLNKHAWGHSHARQFAYACSGKELRPGSDLESTCKNPRCVKSEHMTYDIDRSGLLVEFMSKVNMNGGIPKDYPHLGVCWRWTGARLTDDPNSHGALNKDKWGENLAHIWFYKNQNPTTYDPKRTLNHKCNVGCCVNPTHLKQGDVGETWNAANMRQLAEEGRIHNQVFSGIADARRVRAEYATGDYTQYELAEKYSTSRQAIGKLLRGETWKEPTTP